MKVLSAVAAILLGATLLAAPVRAHAQASNVAKPSDTGSGAAGAGGAAGTISNAPQNTPPSGASGRGNEPSGGAAAGGGAK